MDKFDQHIISLLRNDARMPVAQIAREVSLSRSAVSERIRQLEEQGIIVGYHAKVASADRAQVCAYLELFYVDSKCEKYVTLMRAYPEIKRCCAISGETDMMVYVETASMERLIEIRSAVESFPNMQRVKTHMIMKEWEM
ncbi:AsnC family transcriptional regulator [Pokkaliibacter plantistimulans]|uniref:AsnC family transcriptional regulator n=1 Tax=Pokkaliibacter plantistimulans TaxID=1635171 RepID=A0ABX5M1K9_9GAMM|nr:MULTISPECIES: Lrp/AsnC family transcriptional regulator [Pokkaliibacter]MDH2436361.1 Lrp/AsnC family transcriptional regulator [Pokkaliibacter sp. MBI-7]PXF32817.1 AsnC family transcriptional regulator [Pokkaliibacter plantistimulans]